MAASLTPRRHPRDELAERRTGVRVDVYVPVQLGKLIDEARGKFGLTKKQVVVSALMAYFSGTGQHPDVKDLMRLARTWLNRQVSGS